MKGIKLRRAVSLKTASHLQLQALADRRGVSMSAWLEEQIAEHAAAEGVVVLPEDVQRANDARRRAVAERRHAIEEQRTSVEQARMEAFG